MMAYKDSNIYEILNWPQNAIFFVFNGCQYLYIVTCLKPILVIFCRY